MISVHPDTLRAVFGRASDNLTTNFNTVNLRVDRSSLSSSSWMGYEALPSSSAVDDDNEESGGGNMKAPW